jgi:translation initiation factor 1
MKSEGDKNTGIVYSTQFGKTCPKCEKPIKNCVCGKSKLDIAKDGIVKISRETKGRRSASVSVIAGLPLDDNDLIALAKQLKQKCGAGGTVKSGTVEIQGDHRDMLMQELLKLGFKVKLSGG